MQSRILPALFGGLLLQTLALVGCAQRAEVRLQQPAAPPSQRDLQLTTEWSVCATNAGQRECVLEFPSPGAVDGVRDFRLYLRLPGGEGQFPVGEGGTRGFLIQEVGRLRGKALFTSGTAAVSKATLQRGLWRLDLDLITNDGATVRGRAYLREQAEAIRVFTRRFGGDVAALTRRSTPSHAAATEHRRSHDESAKPATSAGEANEDVPDTGASPMDSEDETADTPTEDS